MASKTLKIPSLCDSQKEMSSFSFRDILSMQVIPNRVGGELPSIYSFIHA